MNYVRTTSVYVLMKPLIKTIILRTHKRTKSNSFSDVLFRTLTVWSV
jgi:hypothetical protein